MSEAASKNNSGEGNWQWRGGKTIDKNGYIKVLIGNKIYVKEHRLVMENHIGRKLTKREVVHHINGDKHDNRIENLKLLKNQVEHLLEHNFLRDTHKSPINS